MQSRFVDLYFECVCKVVVVYPKQIGFSEGICDRILQKFSLYLSAEGGRETEVSFFIKQNPKTNL